jgi:aminomethyltransferase
VNGTMRSTAFHVRTAGRAAADAWVARDGFMVPARYGDPAQEALAARTSASLTDFSFVERLRIHGKGAARMLSAAFGFDVTSIAGGESRDVHWKTEKGGVRGMGTLVRAGSENFLLLTLMADAAWFQRAAPRFGVTVRDETAERGMLLLAGPYAFAVLAAADMERAARLEPHHHATYTVEGAPVTVGRWDALGAFTVMMAVDHALTMFDRLSHAGRLFGLTLAGQEALETLLLEAGVPLAGIDFVPARDADAAGPALQSLMPLTRPEPRPPEPTQAEGETAPAPAEPARAEPAIDGTVLAGVEIDSETPVPFAPILVGGTLVGHTLRSAWSPSLRRAIALAQLPAKHATAGTNVAVMTVTVAGPTNINARVTALPFL